MRFFLKLYKSMQQKIVQLEPFITLFKLSRGLQSPFQRKKNLSFDIQKLLLLLLEASFYRCYERGRKGDFKGT